MNNIQLIKSKIVTCDYYDVYTIFGYDKVVEVRCKFNHSLEVLKSSDVKVISKLTLFDDGLNSKVDNKEIISTEICNMVDISVYKIPDASIMTDSNGILHFESSIRKNILTNIVLNLKNQMKVMLMIFGFNITDINIDIEKIS